VRPGRGLNQLAAHFGQRPGVQADLDEPGPDAGAVNSVAPLRQPSRCELIGSLHEGVCREVLSLACAVVTGVRENMQAACLRQAFQEQRIAPEVRRRAFNERLAAQLPQALSIGASKPATEGRVKTDIETGVQFPL
jgi:hypothetical protein